ASEVRRDRIDRACNQPEQSHAARRCHGGFHPRLLRTAGPPLARWPLGRGAWLDGQPTTMVPVRPSPRRRLRYPGPRTVPRALFGGAFGGLPRRPRVAVAAMGHLGHGRAGAAGTDPRPRAPRTRSAAHERVVRALRL